MKSFVTLMIGLVAIAFLLPPLAEAQQPGTYILSVGTMTVGADGKITVAQTSLTLVRVGENPTPPGPGPRPPVPTQTRAQQIQAAAEAATADPSRQETAATLAALYDMISQQIKAGKATGQPTIRTALLSCDQFAIPKGLVAATSWKPFQTLFTSLWEEQVQTNVDDGELAELIDETVVGLKAAAPNMSTQAPTIIVDGKAVPNPQVQAEGPNVGKLNWAELIKFFMSVILPMLLPLLS